MGGANTPAASNVNATGFPTITATNTVPVAYGPQVVNPTPGLRRKQPAGDCSRPVHALGPSPHDDELEELHEDGASQAVRQGPEPPADLVPRAQVDRVDVLGVVAQVGGATTGHVWLRYKTVRSRLRWQYRVEVKKTKSRAHETVRRSYKTGGTF